MKWVAIVLVPILLGFVGYLVFSAEAQSSFPKLEIVDAPKSAAPPVQDAPVTLLFTGDVMLDRGVAAHAAAYGDGALVHGVEGITGTVDAVIPNLEGTITSSTSVSALDHAVLRFTFDPHFASWLFAWGVRAVSLSNNHTDDFGAEGLEETKQHLQDADILYFGSPSNGADLSTDLTIRGRRICLVGYEGFINTDPAPILAEIARLRPSCDYLVTTMHAGEEYQPGHTQFQESVAHAFIDAGADAVIGTHPHVIEPLEIYKGKPIFYSLGNFLFDQDFSWETEHGLAIEASLTSDMVTYTIIPTTIQHSEASLSEDPHDILKALIALVPPDIDISLRSEILRTHTFVIR